MKTFKEIVDELILLMPMVRLSKKNLETIQRRSKIIAEAKGKEFHHKVDYAQRGNRFETGIFGEVAVEQFLSIKFTDLSAGPTARYHVPDMKTFGLDIGIKTSDYQRGNTILIPREGKDSNLEPQVVVIRFSDIIALIAGYASVKTLKAYRSDYYLKDPRAMRRKTGFYGYEYLKRFNTLEKLKELHYNENNQVYS